MMDLEEEVQAVLFKMGQDIKIHRLNDKNMILEIDYEKYTVEILRVFMNYLKED